MKRLRAKRAQGGGIGTMVIFIAIVLIAAIAAYVYIAQGGSLQGKTLILGKESANEVSTRMRINRVYGQDLNRDQRIDRLLIDVGLSSSGTPLNAREFVLNYVTDDEIMSGITWEEQKDISDPNIEREVYESSDDLSGHSYNLVTREFGIIGPPGITRNDRLFYSFNMGNVDFKTSGDLTKIILEGQATGGGPGILHNIWICVTNDIDVTGTNCPGGAWTQVTTNTDFSALFGGTFSEETIDFTDANITVNQGDIVRVAFYEQYDEFSTDNEVFLRSDQITTGGYTTNREYYREMPASTYSGTTSVLRAKFIGKGESAGGADPLDTTDEYKFVIDVRKGNDDHLLEKDEIMVVVYNLKDPIPIRSQFSIDLSARHGTSHKVHMKTTSVIYEINKLYPLAYGGRGS